MNLINRPRRLRTSPTLRSMMRETRMSPSSLIYPIFAIEGENIKNPIASLPGQFQWSPDRICEAIEECMQAGVEKVMLFGLPAHKDEIGSGAWAENGIVQQAIRAMWTTIRRWSVWQRLRCRTHRRARTWLRRPI